MKMQKTEVISMSRVIGFEILIIRSKYVWFVLRIRDQWQKIIFAKEAYLVRMTFILIVVPSFRQ